MRSNLHHASRIIELVAGTTAEVIFDEKSDKLNCKTDLELAEIYASSICSPAAVSAFIDYCRLEAHTILIDHWRSVIAFAKALEVSGTLTGSEIDSVIIETVAQSDMETEKSRRLRMTDAISRATNIM